MSQAKLAQGVGHRLSLRSQTGPMGGTRIFEVGGSEGQGGGHRGANENCCYQTFN